MFPSYINYFYYKRKKKRVVASCYYSSLFSRSRLLGDRNAVSYEINNNETYLSNETLLYNGSLTEDYIFDRTDVKVIFITLYTVVFVCCFFGKSHFASLCACTYIDIIDINLLLLSQKRLVPFYSFIIYILLSK